MPRTANEGGRRLRHAKQSEKTPDPFYFPLFTFHERLFTRGIDADPLACFFSSSQTRTGQVIGQMYGYKTRPYNPRDLQSTIQRLQLAIQEAR